MPLVAAKDLPHTINQLDNCNLCDAVDQGRVTGGRIARTAVVTGSVDVLDQRAERSRSDRIGGIGVGVAVIGRGAHVDLDAGRILGVTAKVDAVVSTEPRRLLQEVMASADEGQGTCPGSIFVTLPGEGVY
jgi:hypothetical protein